MILMLCKHHRIYLHKPVVGKALYNVPPVCIIICDVLLLVGAALLLKSSLLSDGIVRFLKEKTLRTSFLIMGIGIPWGAQTENLREYFSV
jgi:hypothetical protein